MSEEPYVTTTEAAKAVGVAGATLASWVRKGWIKPHLTTLGGRHRWQVERLKRELRERAEDWPDGAE